MRKTTSIRIDHCDVGPHLAREVAAKIAELFVGTCSAHGYCEAVRDVRIVDNTVSAGGVRVKVTFETVINLPAPGVVFRGCCVSFIYAGGVFLTKDRCLKFMVPAKNIPGYRCDNNEQARSEDGPVVVGETRDLIIEHCKYDEDSFESICSFAKPSADADVPDTKQCLTKQTNTTRRCGF